jgi:replicative DNA helicase
MENTLLPNNWRDTLEEYFNQHKCGDYLKQLWRGVNTRYNFQEEADTILCIGLASCFDGDPVVVDAAYRQSGLFSSRWDEPYQGQDQNYGAVIVRNSTADFHEDFYKDFYVDAADSEKLETINERSFINWPKPFDLDDYSDLPPFSIGAIPGPCGDMAYYLARHCQVDIGLAVCMVLAAISTALGGKVKVNLGTHKEPVNTYGIAIVPSGNRKSEVQSQSAEPIYTYQRECQENMASIIREAESKKRILEKRLDRLQKEAAGKEDPRERELISRQCNDVITEMEANPVPKKPVFVVDDITPEALGQLMADNGERMAILSAEGGIFKIISGLYNNGQSNIDLFLKAHAGDNWSNNRIGRESKMMEKPALTLGLAVQPDVIDEIGRNSEFRGRGLSARFLYSLCQSKAGYRTRQSNPLPADVKNAYNKKIATLMALNNKYELTLCPEAQLLWDEFYDKVEKSLRPGAELEHLVDWGSKLPGVVARIAGSLHFADSADEFPGNTINKYTIVCAILIGMYYREHAKAVLGKMKEDSTITTAKKILNYIKLHKPVEFKSRDLFNHTNLQSMHDIQPAINTLLERGYIRETVKQVTEKHKGRPEAVSYDVNPKIFSIS